MLGAIPTARYHNVYTNEQKVMVTITSEVQSKIRYLCNVAKDNEWIGYIFYKVEDDVCVVTHILPLSIDGKAYTEAEDFELILDEFIDQYDLEDHQKGLIHSHNNMQTFFSSTDIDELHENAKNHNRYLSIIVNNYNEITGKVATHIDLIDEGLTYKMYDFNSEEKVINVKMEKTALVLQDVEFINTDFETEDDSFIDYVNELLQIRSEKMKAFQQKTAHSEN